MFLQTIYLLLQKEHCDREKRVINRKASILLFKLILLFCSCLIILFIFVKRNFKYYTNLDYIADYFPDILKKSSYSTLYSFSIEEFLYLVCEIKIILLKYYGIFYDIKVLL